jgi:cold shock CspA family protein
MERTRTGRIRFFHYKRGFGFVKDVRTGEDFFFHFSVLRLHSPDCWRCVFPGEYVQFQAPAASRTAALGWRRHATAVTGICGGPLLVEGM